MTDTTRVKQFMMMIAGAMCDVCVLKHVEVVPLVGDSRWAYRQDASSKWLTLGEVKKEVLDL
jgi:hypothetical protein